jgi:hypothetical protein
MSVIPFNEHLSDIQKISLLEEHLEYLQDSISEKCGILNLPNDDLFLNSYSAPAENPLSYESQLERLIENKKMTTQKIDEVRG